MPFDRDVKSKFCLASMVQNWENSSTWSLLAAIHLNLLLLKPLHARIFLNWLAYFDLFVSNGWPVLAFDWAKESLGSFISTLSRRSHGAVSFPANFIRTHLRYVVLILHFRSNCTSAFGLRKVLLVDTKVAVEDWTCVHRYICGFIQGFPQNFFLHTR